MGVPNWSFDKIAIDLVRHLKVSKAGNQHNLTIIDHLTGWLEAFPIPNKKADTIVYTFINITFLFTCLPDSYCLIMEQSSKIK